MLKKAVLFVCGLTGSFGFSGVFGESGSTQYTKQTKHTRATSWFSRFTCHGLWAGGLFQHPSKTTLSGLSERGSLTAEPFREY
jgi:hypothetical protein